MTQRDEAASLRDVAEARLKAGPATVAADDSDLLRLVHELQVHQVELEMQNSELREARAELEVALSDYTELYDFAPVGYLTLTSDGLISKINLKGAMLLGVERVNLLQRRFSSFVLPENQDRWTRHFVSINRHDGQGTAELALQRGDGTIFHAQLECVYHQVGVSLEHSRRSAGENSPAPRPLEVRIALTDISERKQAKEALRKAGALQTAILTSSNYAIIATDGKGVIQIFNSGAERMLGYTAAEAMNKITPADISDPWEVIARAKALSAEFGTKIEPGFEAMVFRATRSIDDIYELTLIRKDGSCFPAEVSITALRDTQGVIIGYLLIGTDNTARKRADAERAQIDQLLLDKNTELESARVVAEKANLAKSDFLSSMSHDLRTPLSAILGFTQLIEAGAPPPTPSQQRSIDQILKAGWYLLELINEILDLALIESGKLSLLLEPVSLVDVMRECQSMIELQAQKRDISVTFPRFEVPYFVEADLRRMKQVLSNLLSNAIKYNRVGGTVVVNCIASTPGRIRICVEDSGEGLSPDKLQQLFQPFNRLGQEASAEQGTGIGLVVCKRLIDLMGGVIGVESTVGKGSVFWIELSLTAEPQSADDTAGATALPQALVQTGAQLYTLLYVEDNPANLMLIEDIIARRPDIRLLSARDGNRGVEIARAALPDVILMDINLPGISGTKALSILAEDPATAHIPVIALSANAIPRDIEKGMEAGFFRYLTKPIRINEFMDTLDVALKMADAKST